MEISIVCQCYIACTYMTWFQLTEFYSISFPLRLSVVSFLCIWEIVKGEVRVRVLFQCAKVESRLENDGQTDTEQTKLNKQKSEHFLAT